MHSGGIGPVIRDGWVCRACWKPNLADETVCYRCKTPRGEQLKVEMGSKVREIDPMFGKRGRLDIEWPVLAYLVSWPLGFDGALGILTGFLGFALGGVLTGEEETILGMDVGTFLMLVAVASIALSVLRIFVARSIQRFARWAYVVAIALTLLGSVPYLVGALPVPYEAGTLSASIHTFRVWVNLAMFFGAIALLVMSFIRRDPSMTDAPEPAPMPVPRPAASAPAAEPHRPLIEPSSGRVAFRNQPPTIRDDRSSDLHLGRSPGAVSSIHRRARSTSGAPACDSRSPSRDLSSKRSAARVPGEIPSMDRGISRY